MPIPNTHPPAPSIKNTRAVINTRWKGSTYRDVTIRNVEQYYVDTALDNDADTWTLTVGDPYGDLLELLKRDSEIRVKLFGVGKTGINFLMTGIADDAAYADGSWTLTGRDYSSLATDSTVRPLRFQKVRPWAVVEEQAKYLGFKQTSLAHGKMIKKLELTDGSETYWEFWYRLYRREKMWIWCEPNGLLVANSLNYGQPPAYYIGDVRDNDSDSIKGQSIPVISAELHKTTQARVYEVIVYGHKGKIGTNTGPIRDNTMAGWLKKPRKVVLDTTNRTVAGMTKIAWEEIFEGKVGELEFKVTIPDPGFVLRQNRIARLNLPDIGLFGNFFIVGSRIQAGPDGFVQEIRLREEQYAVSRRVPVDPKLQTGDPRQDVGFSFAFGQQVEQIANGGMPSGWGDYFVAAAKNFHGTADYDLFLATLLAICDRETSFQNERQHGGPGGDSGIWYPYKKQGTGVFPDPGKTLPGTVQSPAATPGKTITTGETRAQYEEKFANDEGGPYHVHTGGDGLGVGPMQLTTTGDKLAADDMLSGHGDDQYEGGRWHPEYNIWIAGRHLHNAWVESNAMSDKDMWMVADIYNRGLGGWQKNPVLSSYGLGIKKLVGDKTSGYLQSVQGAVVAAKQDVNTSQRDGPFTTPDPGSGKLSPNGKYILPLSTPVDFNQSEFQMVDAEGAPDQLGIRHHAGKDWFAPGGGANVVSPAIGVIVDIQPSTNTSGQVFGGQVKVQMQNGHVWVFRHVIPLDGLQLKQRVKAGELVANVVRWSDNPKSSHCHIEFWMSLAGGYYFPNMRDPCKILTQ